MYHSAFWILYIERKCWSRHPHLIETIQRFRTAFVTRNAQGTRYGIQMSQKCFEIERIHLCHHWERIGNCYLLIFSVHLVCYWIILGLEYGWCIFDTSTIFQTRYKPIKMVPYGSLGNKYIKVHISTIYFDYKNSWKL